MVNAYTKKEPDFFKLQLQAVLTTYYKDIKGVQGASGCHKTRIVKRRFKAQEGDTSNKGADAADAAAGAGTAVLPGATPAQARRAQAAAGGACSSCTCPQPCWEGGGTGCKEEDY
jgi:hypothetical protein